jgi:hypothetical protein
MSSLLNLSMLLMLVAGVFGILGVQLFSGLFYRCDIKCMTNFKRNEILYAHDMA